jgi:hypothetical protein
MLVRNEQVVVVPGGNDVTADTGRGQLPGDGGGEPDRIQSRVHGEADPRSDEVVGQPRGVGVVPPDEQRLSFRLEKGGQRRHADRNRIDGYEDPFAVLQPRLKTLQQRVQIPLTSSVMGHLDSMPSPGRNQSANVAGYELAA